MWVKLCSYMLTRLNACSSMDLYFIGTKPFKLEPFNVINYTLTSGVPTTAKLSQITNFVGIINSLNYI